jgi:hypothetical protein
VRRGEHKCCPRNGGQGEEPSGGILQPIHDWDSLKCNLWAGDSHYGRMKSSFDGDGAQS